MIYNFSIVVSSVTTFTLENTQVFHTQKFSNISSNKQDIQAVSQSTHSTLLSPIWRVIIIITYRLKILHSDNTTGYYSTSKIIPPAQVPGNASVFSNASLMFLISLKTSDPYCNIPQCCAPRDHIQLNQNKQIPDSRQTEYDVYSLEEQLTKKIFLKWNQLYVSNEDYYRNGNKLISS